MSVSETHELNVPLSDTLIFVSNPKVVPFYPKIRNYHPIHD